MVLLKTQAKVSRKKKAATKDDYDVQIYAQKIKRAREIVKASGLSSDPSSSGFGLYKIAFAVVLEKLL